MNSEDKTLVCFIIILLIGVLIGYFAFQADCRREHPLPSCCHLENSSYDPKHTPEEFVPHLVTQLGVESEEECIKYFREHGPVSEETYLEHMKKLAEKGE